MNPLNRRLRWMERASHISAVITIIFAIAVDYIERLFRADERVHLLRRTIIFHADGRIVIRQPDDHLVVFSHLPQFDPDWIFNACRLIILMWVIFNLVMIIVKRHTKAPRGFPVKLHPTDT